MIDPSEILAQFSEQQVAGFLLVLGRISPLFLLAPLFSNKLVPMRAKAIVAVGLTIGIFPIAAHAGANHHIELDGLVYGALMLKEILVGITFSLVLACMFAALSSAGALLDLVAGFSFGSLVDPVTGNQSTVIAQLYSLFGVAILIAIGGDAWIIKGLGRTYEAIPMLDTPAIGSLVEGAQVAFSGIFVSAFMIGAPVIIALIITDAAFGVVSRVVPQMNIFAVGFPAKMIVGLVLLGASLPFVSNFFIGSLQDSVGQALHFLKVA
jgi:flagellar biosynthetic protein FliR